jgi:Zn ribbon nucleic-acid-binding protein
MNEIQCVTCAGKGYWLVWGNDGKEIKDCYNCGGHGTVKVRP